MAEVFTKRNRQPGTIVSASTVVQAGVVGFQAVVLMNAADIADPTLEIRFACEGTYDPSGLVWVTIVSKVWQCGARDRAGNFITPTFRYEQRDSNGNPVNIPLRVRALLDIPRMLSIGLDVSEVLV